MSEGWINRGRMIDVGSAGEHLVCADLILAGLRACQSSQGCPFDVVAELDGGLCRVAVKSTLQARPRSGRVLTRPCYQFNILRSEKRRYTKADTDIIALVALDRKMVAYLTVEECPSIMHLDEPGQVISYPNVKGPKPGQCKQFSDFPLEHAIAEWRTSK